MAERACNPVDPELDYDE
jgi:hypothetical protein